MSKKLKIQTYKANHTKSMKITKTDFIELGRVLHDFGNDYLVAYGKKLLESGIKIEEIDHTIRMHILTYAKHNPIGNTAPRTQKLLTKLNKYLNPSHIDSALKRLIPSVANQLQ